MRIIIVGLNEQGLLRQKIAGNAFVALVSNIQEVPINSYDAVIICTENENKYTVARYALVNKKHVLLSAPLWATSLGQLDELEQLSITNNVVFYIGYNYKFVADFIDIKQILQQKKLGEIYHCRVEYAAKAEHHHNGALIDLSPHLLNLLCFWFGTEILQSNFSLVHKDKFGRHVIIGDFSARSTIEIAAHFFAPSDSISLEIYGARDNLQLRYALDDQKHQALLAQDFAHFQELCQLMPLIDCMVDKWIYAELDRLASEATLLA